MVAIPRKPLRCVCHSFLGCDLVTRMSSSQFHYLPLSPAFFSLLVGVLVVVVVLIQLGILRYA